MDYSKWKKIAVILAIISLLFNIFTKVFASSTTLELLGNHNLEIDIANHTCILDGQYSISSDVWQHEHIAFRNFYNNGYNYLDIIVWDGNLTFNSQTLTMHCPDGLYYRQFLYERVPYIFEQDLSHYSRYTQATGLFAPTNFIYSSGNIYNEKGEVIVEASPGPFNYPHFSTPDNEITSCTFDKLYIEPGDYGTANPLYLHILQITQTLTDDDNTYYYYSDNEFILDSSSTYYTQFGDSDYYYYGVPRRRLGFNVDSKYLLVLSDSPTLITNSEGPIEVDVNNGIFEVVPVNTTDIYTHEQVMNDNIQNIQHDLTDTTPNINNEDISSNFDYNTNNEQLTSNHSGFFSRLLELFTNLYNYDLTSDTPIEIPMPNTDKKIILHSNIISSNIHDPLKSIISAFWMYVFYLYAWKFFNYIYIEIQSGKILDDDNSNMPGTIHMDIL